MILGIYGSSGLGREVLILAQQINNSESRWSQIVFINDFTNENIIKGTSVYSFDDLKNTFDKSEIEIIIAVGEPDARNILLTKVKLNQYQLAVLVHPNVNIPECTKIGEGTVICTNSYISCEVLIGSNVYVQPFACVGHNVMIGDNTVISSYASIGGFTIVGNNNFIAMNCSIKDRISIGNETIIGMGAVVTKSIPEGVVAYGNPAKVINKNVLKRVFK
jgi:sugar O-acyltransferase (sialic acid O-acetyltransferase NeuD family)